MGADHRRPDADRAAGAADRADPPPRQPRLPVRDASRRPGRRSRGSRSTSTRRCHRPTPRWPGATGARPRTRSATSAGSYDRALMLSLLDDEEALAEAIEIARDLGAEPLTRRVTVRMRELGLRVPRGQREASRANPAGLTTRQLEVLILRRRGPDERGDRRTARRLTANGRAPCRRSAAQARRHDPPRRGPPGVRARPLALASQPVTTNDAFFPSET